MQKTEMMFVTPAKAREMLTHNTDNRTIRRMGVDAWHSLWKCGEYKLTHQGIAFDVNGVLKDGQHRLTFISELPEGTKVPLNVTTGMAADTFGAIDVGIKRTRTDELRISEGLSAVAGMLAKIYNQNQHHNFSIQYIAPFVDFARPHYEDLTSFCPAIARTWSSAAIRTAAIVQIARGHNPDFVKTVYRSLVMSDFDTMTQTARALVKQQINGTAARARSLEMFCRGLRAFDSIKPATQRIQLSGTTETTADVREFLFTQINAPRLTKKDPRNGGSKQTKSGANSTGLKAVA